MTFVKYTVQGTCVAGKIRSQVESVLNILYMQVKCVPSNSIYIVDKLTLTPAQS